MFFVMVSSKHSIANLVNCIDFIDIYSPNVKICMKALFRAASVNYAVKFYLDLLQKSKFTFEEIKNPIVG